MNVWYFARGAGLSALVLLSLSTALGALVSGRGPAGRRFVVQYLHRTTAGLGLAVLAVHIGLILADSYAKVGWLGALVPFESGYRPGWVALGTLASYVFVLVALLGLARGRLAASPIGARTWRGIHALAYLGWLSAMWHGFLSGTDADVGWVRVLYLGCLVVVLGATAWRITTVLRRRSAGAVGHPSTRADRFGPRPPIVTSRVTPSTPTFEAHSPVGAPR